MHESGLIRRLLDVALAEADRGGGRLAAIHLRLGALAGGSAGHLQEHFEVELAERGLPSVDLAIEEDPEYPGGVEITAIDLERAS